MPYKDKAKQAAYQNKRMKKQRLDWVNRNGPCQACGSDTELVVDHVDSSTKVSHRVWSWSKERRERELAKCQVLCWPCNRQKETDLREGAQGESNGNSKLTWEAVRRLRGGEPVKKIMEEFGVEISVVYKARRGDTWNSKGS